MTDALRSPSWISFALAACWAVCASTAAAQPAPAERSMLRIVCDGPSLNAEVTINGEFKGECPLDISVPAGAVELRAVKKADATHERVYERSFRIGSGVAKREEIELGQPQLTADGLRLQAEMKRHREAELAEAAERQRVAAAQAAERQRQAAEDAVRAQAELLAKAEAGDPPSMLQRATQLDRSPQEDPLAPQRSFDWYLKAAQGKEPQAMFRVARRYENGYGVSKDLQKAADWYREAHKAGNAGGTGGLAAFAFNGWGPFTTRDYAQARTYAEAAAAADDTRAMYVLAMLYLTGNGGLAQDQKQAGSWIERAASLGDRRAIGWQANKLYSGSGTDAAVQARALQMARRVAEPGEDGAPGIGSALSMLGQSYEFGLGGLSKDPVTARAWYEKATAADDAMATFNLATFHWQGQGGLPVNEVAALALFRRAAALGYAGGMNNVGWFYQHGLGGLKVDKDEAAKWYRQAEAAGAASAHANLKSLGWFY